MNDNLLDDDEDLGLDDDEPDEPRVLPVFLRGQDLAQHVAVGMAATNQPAHLIAATGGYKVDTCAIRLAEAGHAPLGRMLLERHWRDQKTGAAA